MLIIFSIKKVGRHVKELILRYTISKYMEMVYPVPSLQI